MSLRIIGINGEKRSGKSALAEALSICAGAGSIIAAFADPLKHVAMDIYDLTAEQVYDPELKEVPIPRLATPEFPDGLAPRVILQRLGTEVGRSIAKDTWVWAWRRAVARARQTPCPLFTTPDMRFRNEAQALLDEGALLVRVLRPGLASTDTHASETEGKQIPVHVEVINDGSLAQLQAAAPVVLGWAHKAPTGQRLDDLARGCVMQFRCAVGVISSRSAS